MDAEPTSIPELLRQVMAARRLSARAASGYIGVAENAVGVWLKGQRVPDPEPCRKIAAWSGYPPEFVLRLAGHLGAEEPQPEVEIDPELGLLIKRYSPADQRKYLLPIVESALGVVRALREERAPYDAGARNGPDSPRENRAPDDQ